MSFCPYVCLLRSCKQLESTILNNSDHYYKAGFEALWRDYITPSKAPPSFSLPRIKKRNVLMWVQLVLFLGKK